MECRDRLNKITERVIGIAFETHRTLGPGFNEKIYSNALVEELKDKNIRHEREKIIEVNYKDKFIGQQRVDFLIEDEVIVELKAIETIGGIHIAQILSYLKTLNKSLGLILNFAKTRLEIKRVVNKF